MLAPGSTVSLIIEKPAAGGRTIARHEGQIVLVSRAIPGERVVARIDRVAAGVAYAETVEILEAAADRRPTDGDWACGGNVYSHIAYQRQCSLKAEILADAFGRIARVRLDAPVLVVGSPEWGYRMRARLHVRDGRLGFFREGTHQLCDAAGTGQLRSDTTDVLEALARACARHPALPVHEVQLSENVPATNRALELELTGSLDTTRLQDLADIAGTTGVSAFVSQLGQSVVVSGSPFVSDGLPVVDPRDPARQVSIVLRRHVRAFFQGNRFLLTALVGRVVARVPPGPVIDLYAGVGLFGVALAALDRGPITAVEGDRTTAADLRMNAAPYRDRLTVVNASVERYLSRQRLASNLTVLVDPPRTGLSRVAITGILSSRPSRVVYVSCDVATLARDVRRFKTGGYLLTSVEAFDLFPNTAHVETLAVLERGGGAVSNEQ